MGQPAIVDRGDRCIDVRPLGDVAGEGFGDPAGGPDVGRDLLGGVEIEVEYGDLGAFRGEASRCRPADSAAAAGHHDHLARKTRHVSLPP